MDDGEQNPLIATYLARRPQLLSYFRARLRSEAAAEDLVQDIYVRISDLDPAAIDNPAAYLYRLGSNLMLDRIRQQRRAERREADWQDGQTERLGGEEVAQEPAPDMAIEAKDRLERILQAVNALPPAVQEAFRLHKLEGLTHAETAAAMGVSRSSVEKYIMTSLQRIIAKVGR